MRGLTPLVGRDEEIRLLLSRWQERQGGRGPRGAADRRARDRQIAHHPGVSRARALRPGDRAALLSARRSTCTARCIRSSTSWSARPPSRRAIRPRSSSTSWRLCSARGPPRSPAPPTLLAPLLSIPTGGRYPPLDLAPERKKALMLEALLEQLAGLAARPVLIILEDAHWIDPTTTELFKLIIDRIQRLPVLVIVAYRPSFTPPWTGFPHITSLSLVASQPPPGGRAGRQGDPRPPAAGRGPRSHRQADRRRPALYRGADQDPARVQAPSRWSATSSD